MFGLQIRPQWEAVVWSHIPGKSVIMPLPARLMALEKSGGDTTKQTIREAVGKMLRPAINFARGGFTTGRS